MGGGLRAQTGKYYSTDNGLSNSLVNCIFQDSKGFVWIGTEYGLNRFDGQTFAVYYHAASDSTALGSNYIRTIFETSDGRLLVGSILGLMEYNWETNAFDRISLQQDGKQVQAHVTDIVEMTDGDLWISTSGRGLFVLPGKQRNARFEQRISAQLSSNYLNLIYKDKQNNVWIGSESNGLNYYNVENQQITIFRAPDLISGDKISAIAEDRDGNLFVGTLTKGLNRYDPRRQRFVAIEGKDCQLIYSLLVDGDNRLLIGTDGQGLKHYNLQTGTVEDLAVSALPFDVGKSKVHAILQDKNSGLWLGLFQKGVVYIPNIQSNFDYYGYKSVTRNLIGSGCVMSMCKDRSGTLWIATDNDGLYGINEQTGKVVHFATGSAPSSIPAIILNVFEDSERNLWIASYAKGLAMLDRRTGACRYIAPLANEKIYYIAEDKQKNLLIGTFGSGLYVMNIRSGELSHYESSKRENNDWQADELSNDWINYILCDSEGLIWIAHYRGLSCFDPHKKTFLCYRNTNNLAPDLIVNTLCEDSKGCIWIGATNALYRFDKKSGELQQFLDPSSGDMICGIAQDRSGNIWVSTYNGLCCLNPQTRATTHYYAGDGLQGNEFTRGAVFNDRRTGKLYFGGTNGVTFFDPSRITEHKKKQQVFLTGFYLFNHPVGKGDCSGKQEIVSTSVFNAERFNLRHSDNTFTLEFSTLDFVNPEQTVYEYKIEGLHTEWTSTLPGINRVTYNNLQPGTYTFLVRLSDVPASQKSVLIYIAAPWYQTGWAYCLYVLLGLLFAGGVYLFVRARVYYRRHLLEEKHTQELSEAKLQFFINISHEIRTPMTLIINPLEKLIAAQSDAATHSVYLIIYRNAQRILRLINQLMDIRKLDKGQMRISCRETDMVGFLEDLMHTFEYTAQQKNIRFELHKDTDQLKVWIDLNNFDKVMLNLMSNAFKFTPNDGEIVVQLSTGKGDKRLPAKEYFEVRVTDNGMGVDMDNIERIFDRFYQEQPDAQVGTGVGLHLSRQLVLLHHGIIYAQKRSDGAQGTSFVVRLPLGNAHLTKSELETPEAAAKREAMYFNAQNATMRTAMGMEMLQHTAGSAEGNEKSAPPKSKTKYRVLLVEDEVELRQYMQGELAAHYRITTCSNGKEALDCLLRQPFDAVVSDVMMPQMDGITLTRKLKQNININHIPIVLLTAKTQDADYVAGVSMGADAYLAKPFRTDVLLQTINTVISNREMLRTKFSGHQQYDEKIERAPRKSSDEILMDKVLKLVSDNLANEELNVEFLASKVGMSRVHMHRKLKELTNQSARDFIRGIRLKQAALMLGEKHFTISEVAYTTGFGNLSHFSSAFKEFYGMSPTEYLEKIKE
ncbi:hybrid sensor histidine kinase/response regulator [Bacteroidia bacterium]|nr:hybrid sensor histidine kinase/response regulator [Bacteroidia bacterium]